MKKSRVIIPALSLIAFSMAASITGAVAWFSANRAATVTAGEFAVVNTSSNLSVTLGAGEGTSVTTDSGETHTIGVTNGYKLTDASFDHTSLTEDIIAPDISGTKVGQVIALEDADAALSPTEGNLVRDGANQVFTAFTWDMTFTVEFGASALNDVGLFLDLSSDESYMHCKKSLAAGTEVTANQYYSDPACTTPIEAGTLESATTAYYIAPVETGKAFRIAFVPTAIGGTGEETSIAYTKVWAENEDAAHCGFVDGLAANAALARTGYTVQSGTIETTALSGNTSTASTSVVNDLVSGTVLMDSVATSLTVPGNGAKTHAEALAENANYLGMFKLDAGKSVSLTFTCVAWFDGTDTLENYGHIVNNATNFETVVSSMRFGVSNLAE